MKRIPDSIGYLQNLQVLWLHNCRDLKTLPAQVASLEKLTSFIIVGQHSLDYYPVEIGNLSNLQTLGWIKPACSGVREGCRISELGKLTQLRRLSMRIDSDDRIGDEELHVLSQLKLLKFLSLNFSQSRTTSDEERKLLLLKVDNDISPCRQLQELYLYDFPGEKTPVWLNPITLPNLRFLSIGRGNMRFMHPMFFGKSEKENKVVWKLEALSLCSLNNLEEERPRIQRAMPSLRLLKVFRCPKLKLFPCDVDGRGTWRK